MSTQLKPGPLVRIDSYGLDTYNLLGKVMEQFNEGNRVQFLTESGQGDIIVQRLRMRLSRLRETMDRDDTPRQHFRIAKRVCPYTNARGQRYDCVILERIKTPKHILAEKIEGMIKDAIPVTNASRQAQHAGGYQW